MASEWLLINHLGVFLCSPPGSGPWKGQHWGSKRQGSGYQKIL